MKITLCTSPHLDRSPLFDGRDRHAREGPIAFAQTFLPMGLLSLASAVKDMTQVRIFDINKIINSGAVKLDGHLYGHTASLILADSPDFVGFMTDCDSFHHVIRVCSSLKAQRPNLIIALGCVHASYNASQILSRYDFVDYIVRGEGEVAFRQLIEAIDGKRTLSDVGNLTFRSGGGIMRTNNAELIENLDTLPWIDPELVGLEPSDAVWVEIGRGCPFKCNFCVTAPYWNRKHRIKSPDRIIAELKMFRDSYGRRDFNFTHDLFTTDRRWVLKFCDAMAKTDLGVTWTCSSRTDTLDEEQLEAMSSAGCRDIYFGVETGSNQMQRAIDKSLGLQEAREIISLCHQYNVSTTVGFIAGLPGESEGSLRSTLKEAANYLQLGQTVVHLFGFGPYRGSTNFESIEDQLIPELEFVDFPLDQLTSNENRALINSHRDVFARYSRMSEHGDSGFVRILEVAEEYFPILNALPIVMQYCVERSVDPFDMLCSWGDWLSVRAESVFSQSYHSHLGSISDFLEFLINFAAERGIDDDRFCEIIRWETLKQSFRSEAPETRLCAVSGDEVGTGVNPTIRIEEFRYAPQFTAMTDAATQSFAFLRRRDGEVRIIRVGTLARNLIELSRQGVSRTEIESAIQEPVAKRQAVRETLQELTISELVFIDD